MKKKQIQPILYERIEQKNEIERELIAKMSPKEKRAAFRTWRAITDYVAKQGEIARAAMACAKRGDNSEDDSS